MLFRSGAKRIRPSSFRFLRGRRSRASPSSGGLRWGYFLCQFQKRAVSNCFGWPGFGQRGQNSSRSDWRRLRSSDRPLGAAGSWPSEAVRNSAVFSYGTENTPTVAPLKKEKPGSGASRKRRKELGRMRFAPGGSGKFCVRDDVVVLPYFV